ncbi:MAG: GDP-mannose 4,6-dehydratase, partial [Candidatus Lokiarchaeota archaeon]|nr:GDP-mannose 4,6-dehydratase [Candidatus Lokiarchaeota archaeon]
DYIEICKTLYDLDVPVLIDPNRLRPSDVPILIGSNEKIKKELNWSPIYPVTKIIKDGISYFQKHKEFLDIESH